jgi:DNA repair exonuclease SbcCD nuclease subunit
MLFKKAIVCTDQHFSRKNASIIATLDNIDFIKFFVEEGKIFGADTVILCGDFFDNRNTLNIDSMNYGIQALEMLSESFSKVYILKGNHDLYYRNNRSVSSITLSKHITNIHLIHNPITFGEGKEGVTFLPWLVGDEGKKLKDIKSRYVFSHLELGNFKMNANVIMPETDHGLKASDIPAPEFVFSGHFHIRQQQKNIVYIGNIFPFDFSDAGDSDRGMMFLEWGKEPFFKAWPDQPLFRNMLLSELLIKPKQLLKPKLTARVTIDVDISYEEAQVIKETFISDYDLRKIELTPQSRSLHMEEFSDEAVIFQSVDQIVIDGLMSVQSTGGMSAETLVELYRNLPNL